MLANILILTFICAFFGIVAFGHVLLITAIWPELFRSRREPHLTTVAGTSRRFHHSK
jgi:hypothetical protein